VAADGQPAAVVGADSALAVVEAKCSNPRGRAGSWQRAADLPSCEQAARERACSPRDGGGCGLAQEGGEAEDEGGCEYDGM
jgi:hypothetical protein